MQNFKTEFPLSQMEREACGYGMKTGGAGSGNLEQGSIPVQFYLEF